MLTAKNILYICVFCVFLFGCEDPFRVPSSESNIGILVVEGRIGDEETLILLSRTANLDSFSIKPEVNALVQIENELGNVVGLLAETEAGSYFLDTDLIVNEKYRIRIETNNQEVYHSDYATLIATPPISDLKARVDPVSGNIEILVSTQDLDNNTRYYQWNYEETYEYSAPYSSILEFDGEKVIPRDRNGDRQITLCWKSNNSSDILLESSIQFDEDVVSNKRLVSYSLSETFKFNRTYSILVNQYALSSNEFEFWSLLEKNSESLGTLFDPQPSQISTNLECKSDPQKGVIGYVGASSKTQKRIFVRNADIPESFRNLEVVELFCEEGLVWMGDEDEVVRILSDGMYVPIEIVPPTPDGDIPDILYATIFCADCREQRGVNEGGTNVRPNFWF
ncbi:MAG: DUF4249 domain-containing protein [Ekhidna sp.]